MDDISQKLCVIKKKIYKMYIKYYGKRTVSRSIIFQGSDTEYIIAFTLGGEDFNNWNLETFTILRGLPKEANVRIRGYEINGVDNYEIYHERVDGAIEKKANSLDSIVKDRGLDPFQKIRHYAPAFVFIMSPRPDSYKLAILIK